MTSPTNLDFICMKTAQGMAGCQGKPNDKENVATKALGVLVENGPYGLLLYLETVDSSKGKIAKDYQRKLLGLCGEELVAAYLDIRDIPSGDNFERITRWLQDLAGDLDRYLFVKRLWQQTLTYTRYHAKALENAAAGQTPVEEDSQ